MNMKILSQKLHAYNMTHELREFVWIIYPASGFSQWLFERLILFGMKMQANLRVSIYFYDFTAKNNYLQGLHYLIKCMRLR